MPSKAAAEAGRPVDVPTPSPFTDTLKIALYGKYGSRKTQQISELIERYGAENVLIVSAEHGLNTIRSVVKRDMVISVANLPELRKAYSGPCREFAAEPDPRKWVTVDGMSQVTEWLANEQLSGADRYYEAMKLNRDPANSDLQFGRFLQRGEINTMAIYGKVGRESENLLAAWIGLPVNLYVNYLEDMTGSSGFERTLPWGPDVPGKVGLKAVMSSFDYVGRLYYDETGKLCAGFDPTSRLYMARTRDDWNAVKVPTEIVGFSLGRFVARVMGEEVAEESTSDPDQV